MKKLVIKVSLSSLMCYCLLLCTGSGIKASEIIYPTIEVAKGGFIGIREEFKGERLERSFTTGKSCYFATYVVGNIDQQLVFHNYSRVDKPDGTIAYQPENKNQTPAHLNFVFWGVEPITTFIESGHLAKFLEDGNINISDFLSEVFLQSARNIIKMGDMESELILLVIPLKQYDQNHYLTLNFRNTNSSNDFIYLIWNRTKEPMLPDPEHLVNYGIDKYDEKIVKISRKKNAEIMLRNNPGRTSFKLEHSNGEIVPRTTSINILRLEAEIYKSLLIEKPRNMNLVSRGNTDTLGMTSGEFKTVILPNFIDTISWVAVSYNFIYINAASSVRELNTHQVLTLVDSLSKLEASKFTVFLANAEGNPTIAKNREEFSQLSRELTTRIFQEPYFVLRDQPEILNILRKEKPHRRFDIFFHFFVPANNKDYYDLREFENELRELNHDIGGSYSINLYLYSSEENFRGVKFPQYKHHYLDL